MKSTAQLKIATEIEGRTIHTRAISTPWRAGTITAYLRSVAAMRWPFVVIIMIIGAVLRLWDISRPFIGDFAWNEVFYATIADNFHKYGLLVQYNYGDDGISASHQIILQSSPLVPWAVYFSSLLLGQSEWTVRLPFLVCGVTALALIYFIAALLYGHTAGLLSMLITAVMPGIVFYSRAVQLDGPMATFGLGAVLFMLLYERSLGKKWLCASSLSLGLAIAAKYTGVLFIPCVALIFVRAWTRRQGWSAHSLLATAIVYLAAASIPVGSWFAYMLLGEQSRATSSASRYLMRFSEWQSTSLWTLITSSWDSLSRNTGHLLWYTLLLTLLYLISRRSVKETCRRYAVPILMIAPFFAQLIYPQSWIANPYYEYPALYGLSIGLALAGQRLALVVKQAHRDHPGQYWFVLSGSLVIMIGVSVLEYREAFHQSYYPWAVVSRKDPLESAKVVRGLREQGETVLADAANTLYYAGVARGGGVASAMWLDPTLMLSLISRREYDYIVYIYIPPPGVVAAILANDYHQVAPAAWAKSPPVSR